MRIMVTIFDEKYSLMIWVLGVVDKIILRLRLLIIIKGRIKSCSFIFIHIESFELNLTK